MEEVRVFYDFIAGNKDNPLFSDVYGGNPVSSEVIREFLSGLDESAGELRVAVPGACFDFFEFCWYADCLDLEGPERDGVCTLQFRPSRLEAVAADPENASFLLLDNSPEPYGRVVLRGKEYVGAYAPVIVFPPGSVFDDELVRNDVLAGFVRNEEFRVFSSAYSKVRSKGVSVGSFVRGQIRSKIVLALRRAGITVYWKPYTNATGRVGCSLDEDHSVPDAAVFSIKQDGRSYRDLERIIDRASKRLPFPVFYDVSRYKRGHLRVSVLPVHRFL